MSGLATTSPAGGPSGGGTVFDIGYQKYDGVREGRRRARIALFRNGVRTALGLGRGVGAKVVPWFFIGVLSLIALIMAIIAGAAERAGGPGASDEMNLPSLVDYYGIAAVLMFLFAALVGPELLCRDRRERTLSLYLVRPLTSGDYVAARYAAFVTVLAIAAWVPQTILFGARWMDALQPGAYIAEHWIDVPRYLAAGLAIALYMTGLALLTASFTTRRAYAAVFLVGLYVLSVPFTAGIASELEGPVGQWLSMFNLINIPLHVNDIIFGEVSEMTEEAPAGKLSATTRVVWFALWTIGPALLLFWRYRRIEP